MRKTIFVSITNAMAGRDPAIPKGTLPLNCARGYWLVDDTKVAQCELLVAGDAGTIAGVWEINRKAGWQPMRTNAIPGLKHTTADARRKFCEVLDVVPLERSLVGSPISDSGCVKRMFGPIRYNF